jgi:hypothetical protein
MQRDRSIAPVDGTQIQLPIAGADGETTAPPKLLGWCQWLSPRCGRSFVGRGQPRFLRGADQWDIQHEQVQPRTFDSPPDLLARACGDDLRMAIYHLMLQA